MKNPLDLPTEVGLYICVIPFPQDGEGKVRIKNRVVYNDPDESCLRVAENIGEYGNGPLDNYKDAGYRWYGPLEIPEEPAKLLDENLLYSSTQ